MKKLLCALLALVVCLAGAATAEGLLERFELVGKLGEDRYLVRQDGLWGVASAAGELILEPTLENMPEFTDGYAVVSRRSGEVMQDFSGVEEPVLLFGVLDATGQIRIPIEYDSVQLGEGVALVRQGGDYSFLEMDGTPVGGGSWFRAEPFSGGYAAVAERIEGADGSDFVDARWGIIDRTGALVAPCRYEALEFGGGLAVVGEAGEDSSELSYGYIDMSGRTVIECQYDYAQPFVDGVAAVCVRVQSGENVSDSEESSVYWGLIDMTGREILPMEYDYITVDPGPLIHALTGNTTRNYAIQNGEAVEVPAQQ